MRRSPASTPYGQRAQATNQPDAVTTTAETWLCHDHLCVPPQAKTSSNHFIDLGEDTGGEIDLDVGYPARLRVPLRTESSRPEIVLIGRGFASEDDAWAAGEQARSALRAAALVAGVPLDVGISLERRDRPDSALAEDLRDRFLLRDGVVVLDDVHGVQVYPDDRPAKVFSASAVGLTVTSPADRFLVPLRAALDPNRQTLGTRPALAMDLYFLAQFESSMRAKVLALVTALEVLSEQARRPPSVQDMLEEFTDRSRAAIADARADHDEETERAFNRFHSELRKLELDSLTEAIRTLVRANVPASERFADREPAAFAARCYGVRSDLVHEGEEGADVQLSQLHGELRRLVHAVLLSVAGVGPSTA